ncbi:RING-H2 finger protein ATL30-like isoform X2 [Capsicum chacoense]
MSSSSVQNSSSQSLPLLPCFMQHLLQSWHITTTKNYKGLDKSIIKSFPTFIYSSVQDYGEGKFGIECAICLVEFVDKSLIRLLTCDHVFHQECIDHWLKSNKTCPVCRARLDQTIQCTKHHHLSCTGSADDSMHGTVNEDESSESTRNTETNNDNNNNNNGEKGFNSEAATMIMTRIERAELRENVEKFTRSRSTGHSIIIIRENEDRFTLRLPQHVKAKFMKENNNNTMIKSCINLGEIKSKTTSGKFRFGELLKLSSFFDKL